MTQEEKKLIELYEFFLREKFNSTEELILKAKHRVAVDMREGQKMAFQEMISFTENLKRTL